MVPNAESSDRVIFASVDLWRSVFPQGGREHNARFRDVFFSVWRFGMYPQWVELRRVLRGYVETCDSRHGRLTS